MDLDKEYLSFLQVAGLEHSEESLKKFQDFLKTKESFGDFLAPDSFSLPSLSSALGDVNHAKDFDVKELAVKKFHQYVIPYLLKLNDKQYHMEEEKLLSHLENDKLYGMYKKFLKKKSLKHSKKELDSFLNSFCKTLGKKETSVKEAYLNYMNSAAAIKTAKDSIKNTLNLNPEIVVEEHKGVDPVSYMAFSNLKTIINDSKKLLSILNREDDLPQWVDEMLAISKNNVSKSLDYILSEKTDVDSLSKDEEPRLVAEAQERSYLSRFKGLFNKPQSEYELKMHELDSTLRGLYKSHGPGGKSLDQRINSAKENIDNTRFIAAKREFYYFNDALNKMANLSLPLVDGFLPNVRAGFFDIFKSKKEQPILKEPGLSLGVSARIRQELSDLLEDAENIKEFLKNIFFPALDTALSNNDIASYSSMLKQFIIEQRNFEEKFQAINKNLSVLDSETLPKTIDEMKESLTPSPDSIDECPCGSRKPWSSCHGIDMSKIKQLMKKNPNLSYDTILTQYHASEESRRGMRAKLKAAREEQEREEREAMERALEEKVAQTKRFQILLKNSKKIF